MTTSKPTNIDQYKDWMSDHVHCDLSSTLYKNHYESTTLKIKQDFEISPFWQTVQTTLLDLNNEYLLKTGYQLLLGNAIPTIFIKPFDSLLNKTYRKNVLLNDKWPNVPDSGWITPDNWFEQINDILRTCFVVKYLDGVDFLADKLQSIGKKCSLPCEASYEASDEGYYAVHLTARPTFDIFKMNFDTELKPVFVEIQITTQLQDVITKLTHKFYEQRRLDNLKRSVKWQWNYKADDFAANYLGHILHYLEGMIMEVRDKQKG